jgi:hypothetical protein
MWEGPQYSMGGFIMKFKGLEIILCVVLCVIFFSCTSVSSAKQLDKSEITGAVPVFSVSFITGSDLFGDDLSKELFQTYFRNNIKTIKQFVFNNHQITLDETAFVDAINGIDNIQVQNIDIGSFKTKRYYWTDQERSFIYAEFVLTGVIREDGSMPLNISIRKDDPEYEPGYVFEINLSISAKE